MLINANLVRLPLFGKQIPHVQDNLAKGDFLALGLTERFPEFRFNLGAGVVTIRAHKPVTIGTTNTAFFSSRLFLVYKRYEGIY